LTREGAWLVVGEGSVRAVAQVVEIDGEIVRVRPLPGPQPDSDFVMRELAVHAADNHRVNKVTLSRLWRLQSLTLLLFGVEVVALLVNIAA
jgi:hypothetical protein